jgi:hypothetical protein
VVYEVSRPRKHAACERLKDGAVRARRASGGRFGSVFYGGAHEAGSARAYAVV